VAGERLVRPLAGPRCQKKSYTVRGHVFGASRVRGHRGPAPRTRPRRRVRAVRVVGRQPAHIRGRLRPRDAFSPGHPAPSALVRGQVSCRQPSRDPRHGDTEPRTGPSTSSTRSPAGAPARHQSAVSPRFWCTPCRPSQFVSVAAVRERDTTTRTPTDRSCKPSWRYATGRRSASRWRGSRQPRSDSAPRGRKDTPATAVFRDEVDGSPACQSARSSGPPSRRAAPRSTRIRTSASYPAAPGRRACTAPAPARARSPGRTGA
jgi:hypothetical protein